MGTQTTTPKAEVKSAVKSKKVSLDARIEKMLNTAALSGKLDLDTLSTIEQHVKKLSLFLGAPA